MVFFIYLENDLNFNYASFDVGENGFYPSPPKSLEKFFSTYYC